MFPKIECHGFKPAPEILAQLRQDLWFLLDLCPSDSLIETEIKGQPGRFEMVMTVNYMGGEFISRSHGQDLARAIQDGLNQVYDQLRFWRDGRFKDVSWIDTLSEYASHFQPEIFTAEEERRVPKILIVDDEFLHTRALERCLKMQGCETTIAASGKDAVEKIMQTNFDLVFLDWGLPDMTGGEALLKVERLNSTAPATDLQWEALRMPIITYSGRSRSNIRLPSCRHFRFIDHWDKSVSLNQLAHQTDMVVKRLREDMVSH